MGRQLPCEGCGCGIFVAFKYTADGVYSFPIEDSLASDAVDVADNGDILVDSGEFGPVVVDKYGGITVIPGLPEATSVSGEAMNGSGSVVGHMSFFTPEVTPVRAFTWSPAGGAISLGSYFAKDVNSFATAISNNGKIAGYTKTPFVVGDVPPGFLIDGGDVWEIPLFKGDTIIKVEAVNNVGAVVGASYVTPATPRAFRWSSGAMMELEPLDGENRAWAVDINNFGEVVGYSGLQTPTIWVDGKPQPVVIEPLEGLILSRPRAINDNGVILCSGGFNSQSAIVLLKPTAGIADLTDDCVVDGADLIELLQQWGESGPADLDLDGCVGPADLSVLLARWTA